MAKVFWKGGTLLGPLPPVMVTCGDMEDSNIITVAWTGIINSDPPKTYISLRPERYSYGIIKERGEFAVNLTTTKTVRWADYLGVHTGRKMDKFKKSGLTKEAAREVSCPLIAESPLSLECRVTKIVPLGTHDMFIADIVSSSSTAREGFALSAQSSPLLRTGSISSSEGASGNSVSQSPKRKRSPPRA